MTSEPETPAGESRHAPQPYRERVEELRQVLLQQGSLGLLLVDVSALSQIEQWTVERVAVTLDGLTRMLATAAESLGCAVLGPDERVGHMVGVRPQGGIPRKLPLALAEAGVHVSIRGEAIRVSPYVYNDEADVRRFLDVLESCL